MFHVTFIEEEQLRTGRGSIAPRCQNKPIKTAPTNAKAKDRKIASRRNAMLELLVFSRGDRSSITFEAAGAADQKLAVMVHGSSFGDVDIDRSGRTHYLSLFAQLLY
jgi:hypothetical protein